MAFNYLLPLRVVQAVLAIIVLGITAHLIDEINNLIIYATSSQINFLLFDAIWTLLVLAYLVLAPWLFPSLAHPFVILGVEAVTMIFWFAGWVALAALLGGSYCDGGDICSSAKADAVFGAFTWIAFVATTVLAALAAFRGGSSTSSPMAVHSNV